MPVVTTDTAQLRQILATAQTLAVVGHSPKPDRPSYQIAQYLRQVGYRVYAVNPGCRQINGQPCYPDLEALPEPVDIVNVFRQSQYLPEVVATAIALRLPTVWAQVGIDHPQAQAQAQGSALQLVTNRCIMVVHRQGMDDPSS